MRVVNFLNIKEADLLAKKFNIFIGISLGNKYFSRENIKDSLLWALDNTKEKVAVLIPDKIHSVNYEVKSGYQKMKAIKTATREGEKIKKLCEEIIAEIDEKKRPDIKILKWQDIETSEHDKMVAVIRRAFEQNSNFRNLVIKIVKENIKTDKLTGSDYEKLATYPVEELPMLISGIEYEGSRYDLLPYPSVSKIDYLAIDLQEGKNFPDITKELNIKVKLGLVEACAT